MVPESWSIMKIRDAFEDDAKTLAKLVDSPEDVLRNVIHDRTVRVASEDGDPIAFLSFDARPDTVYITQIGGDPAACERLLSEPIRFADREGMPLELLLMETENDLKAAITGAGFESVGFGPEFEGTQTRKYRREPQ